MSRSRRPRTYTSDGRQPLLFTRDRDRALRDLMPIVECLTAADSALNDGETIQAGQLLHCALVALRHMPADSPSVKAYTRWLEQNTELGFEPGAYVGSPWSNRYNAATEGDNAANNAARD
jgi:hypothetical protein